MSNPTHSALAFEGPLVSAQLAWSALRGHDLEAVLLGQNTGSMFEPDRVQVRVPAEQLPRALEILMAVGLASEPGGAAGPGD